MTETNELLISRFFAAPKALVYRAFTDPDQFSQWFGPEGFSVPRDTVDMDVRPGGSERYTMVSDTDPTQASPVEATFVEVVENELLVATETWNMPGMPEPYRMEVRIEFHDEGEGTRLILRQGPYTPEMQDSARGGWNSSFGKLDKVLAATPQS